MSRTLLVIIRWYHSCQSWNGKTGEWQIWVNAERVGRGFNNRLVGHVIKGGGVAISGQDQSLLYNKDNLGLNNKPPGLIGEITMLHIYHVALTAGKAHKDHKHHHAHHFKHDGTPIEASTESVTEPPLPQATPLGNGTFLIGGQLQRPQNLNIAGSQQIIPIQLPNGLQIQQQYIPQIQLNGPATIAIQRNPSYPSRPLRPSKGTSVVFSDSLLNPANVQYIDDTLGHKLFRRDSNKRDKRDNPEKELNDQSKHTKKDKRGLVALSDGSIIDDALLSPIGNAPVQNVQKETADQREPAEAEVKAVMEVCSGCTQEPFKKALVLSWRNSPKKLFSGAHYYKGLPICRAF
ncbi:hypothetical protein ACJJTC_001037 [Scirpophaga incertulas]